MSRLVRRLRRRATGEDERGATMIIFALALVAMFTFAALAIDLGNIAQNHQAAVDSTDAASLAGAQLLGTSSFQSGTLTEADVVTQVEQYVVDNAPSDASLTVGSSRWDTCQVSLPAGWVDPADNAGNAQSCIWFNASTSSANVVAVAFPPFLVHYTFGRAGGLTSQGISALSTAEVPPGGAGGLCALCLLGSSGTDLSMTASGNFQVDVSGANGGSGNIAVDSSSPSAAAVTASGKNVLVSASGGAINVVGGATCAKSPPSSPCYTPSPTSGAARVTDPLAKLGVPTSSTIGTDGGNVDVTCSGICDTTLSPGIYSSISLTGSGQINLTLEPGTYVITGPFRITASGQVTVSGQGVLLYLTCGTGTSPSACQAGGQAGGYLSFVKSGGASLDLTPPTTGPFAGLTIYYDRNNTSPLSMTVSGNTSTFSGTIYAASSAVTLTSAGTTSATFDSLVDVGSLTPTASGTGGLDIVYNPSQNASVGSGGEAWLCSLAAGNC